MQYECVRLMKMTRRTMMEMTENEQKAADLYSEHGATAVYDAVNNGTLTFDYWNYCKPCDAETPIEDNACLVCGTTNIKRQRRTTNEKV
jgi:hypothetical protein